MIKNNENKEHENWYSVENMPPDGAEVYMEEAMIW